MGAVQRRLCDGAGCGWTVCRTLPLSRAAQALHCCACFSPFHCKLQIRDVAFLNVDNAVLVAGSDRVTVERWEVGTTKLRRGGPEMLEGHWGARVGEPPARTTGVLRAAVARRPAPLARPHLRAFCLRCQHCTRRGVHSVCVSKWEA